MKIEVNCTVIIDLDGIEKFDEICEDKMSIEKSNELITERIESENCNIIVSEIYEVNEALKAVDLEG